MNSMDGRRRIGRDGWAMRVAVGDLVEGDVVDQEENLRLERMIRPPMGTR